MGCKYQPKINDAQTMAMKWAIGALEDFPKDSPDDPGRETYMMAKLACEGFSLIVGGYDDAHKLLHERDAKIAELEEQLFQLNQRCDSLEMIVNSGDQVIKRFESVNSGE